MREWYKTAFRRNVVDMHIANWAPLFLSRFDPNDYVERLRACGIQSAVVYAHSHAGHAYYPTRVGHMHSGLRGRDILAKLIERCHAHGIAVVAYYSLIYDDLAYEQHPDWRIVDAQGKDVAERSRYGVCCPNSPYRAYARAHAEELCANYVFEGVRFDMTFWPAVCYCPHCRQHFHQETGLDLVRVIDWSDPGWVAFQRCRERWLLEFAQAMIACVRHIRPQVTVEHQASTFPLNWRFGVTAPLAKANDFVQGDFYGDALQGSFVRKLFHSLSPNLPYGFETSSAVSLQNHTGLNARELLRSKAYACLADGGAFVFIDAIDPDGTLQPAAYERMAPIFREMAPYEAHLGGQMIQDVGVYLSTESKHDPADNGKAVDDPTLSIEMPHVSAALGACRALIAAHVPYGVITRQSLRDLARYRVLVLPNVLMMDDEEIEAMRTYVREGGALYASAATSLVDTTGRQRSNYGLGDVLGIDHLGETAETFTYMVPSEGHVAVLQGYSPRYPLGLPSSQAMVQAHSTAQTLAHMVLPYTARSDTRRYASIHSDPPGRTTEYPAVVTHRYGRGRTVYVSADLERHALHGQAFLGMIGMLATPYTVQADAPETVEVTTFDQTERRRLCVSLVSFQGSEPRLPIEGARVVLRLGTRAPRCLRRLPDMRPWPFARLDEAIAFVVPRLETLAMFVLEYE